MTVKMVLPPNQPKIPQAVELHQQIAQVAELYRQIAKAVVVKYSNPVITRRKFGFWKKNK